MTIIKVLKVFSICWISLISVQMKAQISSTKLKAILNNPASKIEGLNFTKEVKEFYQSSNFQAFWLNDIENNNLKVLSDYIKFSKGVGLSEQDYHPELFKRFNTKLFLASNEYDSIITEIKFTDAAVHFLHDILLGNLSDQLSYNGLSYSPSCYDLPLMLYSHLNSGKFSILLTEVEPINVEYKSIKNKLNSFQKMVSNDNFKDVIVKVTKVYEDNKSFVTRLYQLGFISSDTFPLSDNSLKENIKKVQKVFDINIDGVIKTQTLHALNVPLKIRIAELSQTLNYIRWLTCIKKENPVLIVNIPSANLVLYEKGKMILESKVIVGKSSTPTPTLSSKITEVVIYPYWHVPKKIIIHELLPKIKSNSNFLVSNNFEVLNKQGNVIKPTSINWKGLSSSNFPYEIRQSTGCDNSLGLIKLNFYNPYSVYLHDTPGKYLFSSQKRYFSHGCMRVQKAFELAQYILKGNTFILDSLIAKGCIKMQAPVSLNATKSLPVFVLYNTAWVNSLSEVVFYQNIYNKYPH